jgi:hypothetical protein
MLHPKFMESFNDLFEEFYRSKNIANSPCFGVCYRSRNARYLQTNEYAQHSKKITPIVHKLSSHDESLNDLKFLSNLDSRLKRFLGSNLTGKYNLETGLITLPLDKSDIPEESENTLPSFIYSFAGITKDFYDNTTNKIKEKKMLDNIGAYLLLWSLKEDKNPLEIIFNYYPEESPNELLRVLKGKDLEEFIKRNDLIQTG